MSSRGVKLLAAVVILLFGVLFLLDTTDNRDTAGPASELLFPELKDRLNDINAVTLTYSDTGSESGATGNGVDDDAVTLRRDEENGNGRWVVSGKGGYPANTGSLRQLLLALAEAKTVERKTSNPDLYDRLGVGGPGEEGGGVLISARGDNASIALILGNTAQREFRYARIPDQAESWLIDQNPEIPGDSSGWLLQDVVDIDTARVQSAVIRHADGETIRIYKDESANPNFKVDNIPEDRELSYPSVANGMGGVLNGLTLEDVMKSSQREGEEPSATAEFTTFDGLRVDVRIFRDAGPDDEEDTGDGNADNGGQTWITLQASPLATADAGTGGQNTDTADNGDGNVPVEEPAATTEDVDEDIDEEINKEINDSAEDDSGTAEEPSGAAEQPANPRQEATDINERVSGWAYRIADYKADQLLRRWDDILSADESD